MKNTTKKYDMVIIGNHTNDTIISPSGIRYMDGGGFNYGAHAAVLMGLDVAAVTRLAKEDFRVVHALESIGIDVFATATPNSTIMRLHYPTDNVDKRILTATRTAEPLTTDQVKELNAKAFLINASTRDEIPFAVIKELMKKTQPL